MIFNSSYTGVGYRSVIYKSDMQAKYRLRQLSHFNWSSDMYKYRIKGSHVLADHVIAPITSRDGAGHVSYHDRRG